MLEKTVTPTSLALFCRVVDNYGDIGICWRLAQQLHSEHEIMVHLWVDDLISFRRICPSVILDLEMQAIEGIWVRHWHTQDGQYEKEDIADIVIEFFGCDLPPGYITTMAQCTSPPIWLNLEGLTAEQWVEGCHRLPSSHPSLPLTKYFFFPGFNARTGGLLHERTLDQRRQDFQSDRPAQIAFLSQLGVRSEEMQSLKVSLFCYPDAPVEVLLAAWQNQEKPLLCLVPEGVASTALEKFFGEPPELGKCMQRDKLTVRIIPFMPQNDYDKLLWSCDLNFVRGEDSFVRAQWAVKPFIWHIYPQDDHLHHKKLKAFLQTHLATTESSNDFSLAWNQAQVCHDWHVCWMKLQNDLESIQHQSMAWLNQMHNVGDLTSNLLSFVNSKRQ
jgi:uncharacterized repeat protein (TIGR03837 family)